MRRIVLLSIFLLMTQTVFADRKLVIYGTREYQLIEPLLQAYSKARGVDVRYVELASGVILMARMVAEGEHSPADLLLSADVGVLETAREKDLLQPRTSALLTSLIPAKYRDHEGFWFGLSLRARLIFYAADRINSEALGGYADLSAPSLRGKVCIRSLGHVYNQSLIAALIDRWGEETTREWLRGLIDNLARPPQGGDRDQIRALASGVCDVAVANSYYYAMMRSGNDENDRRDANKVTPLWPDAGVHVNISGGGVARHAPHPQLATEFLEFLTGFDSQRMFAILNQEYPVVEGVPVSHTLVSLGAFEADYRPLTLIARQRQAASEMVRELLESTDKP